MARPEKVRIVSHLPKYTYFSCTEEQQKKVKPDSKIFLLVEEYECIKLIDYYSKTQAECAKLMQVSRGTIQVLYAEARKKIARHMVEGIDLEIAGGLYKVNDQRCCYCNLATEKSNLHKEGIVGGTKNMRIAVTYENGQVFQHFGHTEQFKVYDVENGEIVSTQIVDTNGNGHGALAGFLFHGGVNVLICGGIGGGARNALAEAGIELYPGAQGDADEQVKSFIAGKLNYDPNTTCHHHDHEDGHSCSGHKCH